MLVTASALLAACDGSDDSAPRKLLDGSRAAEAVELEGIDTPAVLTSVRVTSVAEIDEASAVATCLWEGWDDRPFGAIVVRVGVSGESVTFRNRLRRGLYGCDNSKGSREDDRRWCGRAFGQLEAGHLRDPRLDVGCTTRDGGLLGFAWIEPRPDAEYVVVEQPGYAEAYEVAGGLPVRVTTTSHVESAGSRAAFIVSEHASDGRRIREYRLEASVAG